MSGTNRPCPPELCSLCCVLTRVFAPVVLHLATLCRRARLYAVEAVELHGPWRGSWLALRRVSRCRPFGARGFDPVPGEA